MRTFIKLAKTSVIYFSGAALTKIIGLLMLPVYTKYVAPADYGYFDASVAYLGVMLMLLFLETGTAALRFLSGKVSAERRRSVISCAFGLFAASCTAYGVVYWAAYSYFKFTAGTEIFFCGLTGALYGLYGFISRARGRNKLFAYCGLFTAALQAGLNIYFLIYLKAGLLALYWSSIISAAAGVLVFEFFTRAVTREFSLNKIDSSLLKKMVLFSLPIVLNGVAFWFCGAYNRTAIAAVLGDNANGLYAVAAKFGVVITFAGGCFMLAWQEMSFHKSEEDTPAEFYSSAFFVYLKIVLCVYILLIPAINIAFPYFIAPAYGAALALAPLYMLWIMLDMATNFLGIIMTGLQRVREIFITTLCGAAFNVIILYFLLGACGVQASNIALCAGFALTWLLREIFLRRFIGFKMNYKTFLPALPFAAAAAFYPLRGMYNYCFFAAAAIFTIIFLRREIGGALAYFNKRIS